MSMVELHTLSSAVPRSAALNMNVRRCAVSAPTFRTHQSYADVWHPLFRHTAKDEARNTKLAPQKVHPAKRRITGERLHTQHLAHTRAQPGGS